MLAIRTLLPGRRSWSGRRIRWLSGIVQYSFRRRDY